MIMHFLNDLYIPSSGDIIMRKIGLSLLGIKGLPKDLSHTREQVPGNSCKDYMYRL